MLRYTLQPVDARIIWSTDDPSVATVDEYGVVTAVGPGTCELTGVAGDITQSTTITCDFLGLQEQHTAPPSISFQPALKTIKDLLYSDYYLSGDFYLVKHKSLFDFLQFVPQTVSIQLSNGDVVWRVPRDDCAAVANEIGASSSIATDSVSEYGYFVFNDDVSYEEVSNNLGELVQEMEGSASCHLEEISKYPDGSIWATVFFSRSGVFEEGLYLFRLSEYDLSVQEIIKK